MAHPAEMEYLSCELVVEISLRICEKRTCVLKGYHQSLPTALDSCHLPTECALENSAVGKSRQNIFGCFEHIPPD